MFLFTFFFRCLSFSPWWPLAFPLFLTVVIKFWCFSFDEIGLLCFYSRSSSFSIIHDNVDIKIKSKERISFVVVVFIAKSPRSYAIYRRNVSKRASAWNAKFHPGLHEGVDVRRNVRLTVDLLRTKISWMHRLPNFLTHGVPLRALRARESSAIKTASKQVWLWFAEPRGGDTQALPQIFRLCWIPKKSLLNQAAKVSYPKKSRNRKFLLSPSLEIRNTPPSPRARLT